jgi:aryl-alcohol dehydrogenase-like predicted oxidoreductase
MKTTKLNNCELEITEIGLGCMSMKGDFKSDKMILDAFLDGGGNFLDTADLYLKGENEKELGRMLKDKRNSIILASKGGNQWRSDGSGWDWNADPKYLTECVDNSLNRLQTDYIDLYQLHGGTLNDDLEGVFEVFEQLKDQGKIRAYGISSIRPNVIRKVLDIAKPATIMMQYSPLDRRPEEIAFPLIATSETKVLTRGSFAKGLLIDKSADDYVDSTQAEVKEVREIIANSKLLPEAFLIRFGLVQPAVASLVIGTSSVEQVKKLMYAYHQNEEISEDLFKKISSKIPINKYSQHR